MIFLLTVTSPLEVSSALVNHWLQARSTRTCANECWITAIGIAVSGWTVYPYLAKLSDFWVDIQRLTMLYCQLPIIAWAHSEQFNCSVPVSVDSCVE